MNAPLLSVIIPLYNTSEYLSRCIRSVYDSGLTSTQMEVIAVNDGSTDDSLKVLQELQKEYPSLLIVTQENRGQSEARNRGIAEASGEYLFFVDSDDYILSHEFRSLIESGLTADLITFAALKTRNGKVIKRIDSHTHYSESDYATERYEMGVWCYLFKRTLIHKHGLRFEKLTNAEDFLFTTHFLLCEHNISVRAHSCPIYIYCMRKNSITNLPSVADRQMQVDDKIRAIALLKEQLNVEQLKRIDKRLCFFASEVFMLCIRLSLPKLTFSESNKRLRALGYFPLPRRKYGWKYSVFIIIANRPTLLFALRKVLKFAF